MCRKNASYYETVFVKVSFLFLFRWRRETGYHVNKSERDLNQSTERSLPFQKNNSLGLSKIKCFREKMF